MSFIEDEEAFGVFAGNGDAGDGERRQNTIEEEELDAGANMNEENLIEGTLLGYQTNLALKKPRK